MQSGDGLVIFLILLVLGTWLFVYVRGRMKETVEQGLVALPEDEEVQSRFDLVLGRVVRLVGRMSSARRTAIIVPPFQVVTLAWALRSLAHAETIGQAPGFLMTFSRLDIVLFS